MMRCSRFMPVSTIDVAYSPARKIHGWLMKWIFRDFLYLLVFFYALFLHLPLFSGLGMHLVSHPGLKKLCEGCQWVFLSSFRLKMIRLLRISNFWFVWWHLNNQQGWRDRCGMEEQFDDKRCKFCGRDITRLRQGNKCQAGKVSDGCNKERVNCGD